MIYSRSNHDLLATTRYISCVLLSPLFFHELNYFFEEWKKMETQFESSFRCSKCWILHFCPLIRVPVQCSLAHLTLIRSDAELFLSLLLKVYTNSHTAWWMASTNEISENADKEFQFSVCMGNSPLKLRQATSRQSSVYFSFEVHSYDLIRPELSLSLLSASAIPFLLKISFQLQFSIFPSIQWESLTFF